MITVYALSTVCDEIGIDPELDDGHVAEALERLGISGGVREQVMGVMRSRSEEVEDGTPRYQCQTPGCDARGSAATRRVCTICGKPNRRIA